EHEPLLRRAAVEKKTRHADVDTAASAYRQFDVDGKRAGVGVKSRVERRIRGRDERPRRARVVAEENALVELRQIEPAQVARITGDVLNLTARRETAAGRLRNMRP